MCVCVRVCVCGQVLTNLHSFTIIAPNHAGRDIYRFTTPVKVSNLYVCMYVCMY